ncbi:alpha-mannosidase [Petroclostridium xylanilyticum]|uniref:alpha-mannosidase n=1 Tax=Petroclostridium xylanilyticum TaxID=1792311 RepID=UPI000B98104B|nr:glycoside hydrolase family 38 C-terminal domain-containing protein [Petroclostridium xylanilyticum]
METFYIISTTHWDREWYRTFNDFRIRLCDLVDQLLEILDADPEFKCFTFDGQTVILEDYLEIYPEKEDKIRQYIKEGRISIGPWYIIPDEFIPSGESTIRNLLMGDKVAGKFGKKLMCGYLPDNFGHISQLPQILKNFHIDNALFFRGIDKERAGKSEFYWEAPDGSKILCEHLVAGYWNLKSWGHLGMEPVTQFKKLWDVLKDSASVRSYLMLNGSDHLYPQPDMTQLIRQVRDTFPEIQVVNASIQDFIDGIKKEIDPDKLKTIRGELRDGKDAQVNPSVESTRCYVKQTNHKCETELEKYTEPLSVFSYMLGGKYPQNFINQAWKELIKNHPHDSICGCSSDAVMEDVMTRYKHSYEISSRISELAFENLVSSISTKGLREGQKALIVYNPLGWSRTDIIETVVGFPMQENVKDVRIYDVQGNEIAYELIDVFEEVLLKEFKYKSKEKHPMRNFKIRFIAKDVPPLGYKTYIVHPSVLREKRKYQQYQMTKNFEQKIENEFYAIFPKADGTVSIYDKKNDLTYERMNLFEDRGDCGDEYQYASPFVDEVYYPVLKGVSIVNNTPLQSTLKMELELNIPERLDDKYFKRDGNRVSCPIVSYITLYQGINRIDFKTVVENNAADHILCVKFPTDIKADYDYAHSPFDVIKRSIEVDEVKEEDNEILTPFKPLQLFMSIHDDKKFLTLGNKGLYEYQVKRSTKGLDVLLTLIRSVRWMFREVLTTSRDGQPCTTPIVYTPDARCAGTQIFEYSLVLHNKSVIEDNTYKQAYEFNYPLRAAVADRHENGFLPPEYSWFTISDDRLIVSALKKCEKDQSLILRMYNIDHVPIEFEIETAMAIKEAYQSNMLEESIKMLEVRDKKILIRAKGREIITLKIYY